MVEKVTFNPDIHVMLRGYPREKAAIKFAEEVYGGKVVGDNELALLATLDTVLAKVRMKIAVEAKEKGIKPVYPDMLQLPNDPDLYMPIPFNVQWQVFTLKSFHKPAWIRIRKLYRGI